MFLVFPLIFDKKKGLSLGNSPSTIILLTLRPLYRRDGYSEPVKNKRRYGSLDKLIIIMNPAKRVPSNS